jgi:DNA-binding SARP family transcriptional activator
MAGDSLEQAHQILSDCGDRYHLMVTYFWLAVLYHSENNAVFVRHLRECLQLAVAHQYDYYFRTEIQASIPLLVSALEHDLWPSYVTPILAKLGPNAVDPLRALLAHNDRAVRGRAENALKAMGVTIGPARAGAAAPPRRKQPAIPLLTIQALGNFSVWRGDQIVEEREWGRRKCKRLLKYLALSPQHTVSKDTAMELLWGDSDPQAANANFYRTLYNLRRVLEPLSPHSSPDYIVLEGGAVSLVENLIAKIDTEEFVRGVEEGRRLVRSGDLPGARSRLAEAVAFYRDDLSTDDLYDDWLQPPREQLRQMCLDALELLADLSGQAGEMDAAAEYMRQVLRKDRTCEDACRKLMHFLVRSGRRGEALQHYGTLEKALAELGLAPSSELKSAQQALLVERVTS